MENDPGNWTGRQDHGDLGYEQHESIATTGLVCEFAPPWPNELTSHYSAAEVAGLIAAVSKIEGGESAPVLTLIRAIWGKTGAQKNKPPNWRL